MRIIVAADIIGGRCVRLTKGDFNTKKEYYNDPLDFAREVEASGLKYLHLVDLDGAKARQVKNLRTLEKIASKTSLTIDFGGGIRTLGDVQSVLNAGASQVTAGSIAVSDREMFLEWLRVVGPEKLILGADAMERKISSCGWLENSGQDVISFITYYRQKGVEYTVCTDIEKDGMLEGPSFDLYRDILKCVDIKLIASGGISAVKDIEDLAEIGCEGAIIGKAIYEGRLTLKQLAELC